MELEEADEIVSCQARIWHDARQMLKLHVFYPDFMSNQIEQMEVEIQSVPKEHKTKLQIKLRSYKAEMSRNKSEVVSHSVALL